MHGNNFGLFTPMTDYCTAQENEVFPLRISSVNVTKFAEKPGSLQTWRVMRE